MTVGTFFRSPPRAGSEQAIPAMISNTEQRTECFIGFNIGHLGTKGWAAAKCVGRTISDGAFLSARIRTKGGLML
ncbi:MAG: hypothetical protein Fues2KO_41660 [Fuerstiella sp.]